MGDTIQLPRVYPAAIKVGDRLHMALSNETYTVASIGGDSFSYLEVALEDSKITLGFNAAELMPIDIIIIRSI